jgi:hypothetical protein
MTDRAAAAHRGVPGSSGTGTVGCGLAGPLDGPVPRNVGIPSANAWCVPVGVLYRLCARAPLSKRPGSPSLFSVFPRSRHRITTRYTRDKHSAHLSHIATWHVDNSGFLCVHRRGWRFSQVKGPAWMRPGSGIPSISTAHPQAKCCCTQVIHIFVHSGRQAALLPCWQQPVSAPVLAVTQRQGRTRGYGPGADEIVHEPGRGPSPSSSRLPPPVVARARSDLTYAPAVTQVIAAGIPAIAGVAVLEEEVPARAESSKAPHV